MPQQLGTAFAWHALVADQHGDLVPVLAQHSPAFFDRQGGDHRGQRTDQPLEILQRNGFVVNVQNFFGFHRGSKARVCSGHGKNSVTVAPCPGWD
ncbi:hypothetical protein Y695_04529 [Hydrogenophaga sp. T4]|nr:hypothetical protein Y695_04529 [Hydrogenophaga sp. T4]